jgi:hypothetical protein
MLSTTTSAAQAAASRVLASSGCSRLRELRPLQGSQQVLGPLSMKYIVSTATVLLSAGALLAQGTDPQSFMDELLRQKQIEMRQRFEDQQQQRRLEEQERAYDREMCLRVGYRGPDVEQCVRNSAAWRRGARPGLPRSSPAVNCTNIELGAGISDTQCD